MYKDEYGNKLGNVVSLIRKIGVGFVCQLLYVICVVKIDVL